MYIILTLTKLEWQKEWQKYKMIDQLIDRQTDKLIPQFWILSNPVKNYN